MNRRTVIVALVLVLLVFAAFWLLTKEGDGRAPAQSKDEELKIVRFGMLPYGDHTYAIIGTSQGWFREVGIDLQYQTIKVEQIVPYLLNGQLDVVSTPPGILFAAGPEVGTQLVHFVFGDLFQGYALLARPDAGFRNVAAFRSEGLSEEEALRAAASQVRGQSFAYPPEAAIQPFVDLVLSYGGVTDFTPVVLDDPLTINAMRDGQAKFQTGGVPSRLILQKEGFFPVLSSIDFARLAEPSADSSELASVLQNGWATTRQFFSDERDTVLRLASVNYRIMQFINEKPVEAARLHMPYLSEVTGEAFGAADAEVIYSDLDPFVTFEDQYAWFFDPENPLYYRHVNGSILREFVQQGIFGEEVPDLESFIYGDDVYRELDSLRLQAVELVTAIEKSGSVDDPETQELVREARRHFKNYNYLDAVSVAQAAAEQAGGSP